MTANARHCQMAFRAAATLLASASFGVASFASADTAGPTNLAVTAQVTKNCTIAATTVAFGTIDLTLGASKDITSTGALTVTCTKGATYSIAADKGAGAGASNAVRKMTITGGGTDTLDYTLYTDNTKATVWGDTSGTDITGTGTGVAQTLDITGTIAANQQAPAGSYQDTVVVTLTY